MTAPDIMDFGLKALFDQGFHPDELQSRIEQMVAEGAGGSAADDTHDASLAPDATLEDLIAHAKASLPETTYHSHAGAFRFLKDGWQIGPDEYDAAAAVLREQKMAVPARDELEEAIDRWGRPCLVMWKGYGDLPMRSIGGASLDLAIPQKRAATLTEQRRRNRLRDQGELSPTRTEWDGNGAVEKLILAVAWAARVLRRSGPTNRHYRPTEELKLPTRGDSNRRATTEQEDIDVYRALELYAPDPELAKLLFRFHLWTGHRPVAARNLKIAGIDLENCSITAVTKYGEEHTTPAPRELCEDLLAFAHSRGSYDDDDPVFRTKNKSRGNDWLAHLNGNAYCRMHKAVQEHVAWAGEQGWTFYWLRHTANKRISEIGGFDCGIALLGHKEKYAIERYGKASFEKTAWAVSVMTGRPHPKARAPRTAQAGAGQ